MNFKHSFRQSLLIGTSALALNTASTAVAILIPDRAMASCLTVSSDTTISNSATNCITWDSGNISITSGGTLSTTGSAGIGNTNHTVGNLNNSGVIGSNQSGIDNSGSSASIGTITNSGTVNNSSGIGIANSGNITDISNTGLIRSGSVYGILNVNSIGTIDNQAGGTISGNFSGITNTSNLGTLSNSGLITGTTGFLNNGTASIINNMGTINGTTIGIGSQDSSSIGTLSNSSIGSINGGSTGVYNTGSIGSISNSGKITGSISGINNRNFTTVTTSGSRFHSGTIGTLTNSGTISGATGLLNSGSIGSISNTGVITGSSIGLNNTGTSTIISGTSALITGSGSIGTISNSGTISGQTAIYNSGTIGNVSNSGIIIGAGLGISNSGSFGSISNTSIGTISGSSTGIANNTGGTIGAITNSGTISGVRYGILNNGSIGSITNNSGGHISGGNGILNNGTLGVLTNDSGGTISGASGAVNTGTLGTLINKGVISGGDGGIGNFSGTIGTINNSGLISSTIDAIQSSGAGASIGVLSNTGTISGNINVNQDLSITGGNSATIGSLTGGTITANNLLFDSAAYQLLNDNVNVGSGAGTFTNSGVLQVNSAHTITGNYTQGTGASLLIGVTSSISYGSLFITGNANMANDHVTIAPITGSLTSGETFTIVRDAGTANYSGITATASGFTAAVTSSIISGDDDLLVSLSNGMGGGGGGTYSTLGQTAGGDAGTMGSVLDQLSMNGNAGFAPILTALGNLPTGSPAQIQAIKQLAPSQAGAMMAANNAIAGQNIQVVSQHQQTLTQNDNGAKGEAAGSGYQSGVFWGQVSGGFANRETTGGTDGYHQSFGGLAMGADDHLSEDTTVGIALGWMQGRASGSDNLSGSNLTTNSVQLTGYGTHQFGAAFVNGMAGVGYNFFDQSRYISFLNENAKSSYEGMQYVARVDGGWNLPVNSFTLTPLAGIQAIRTDNDSYNESGAGMADLNVGHLGANTLTTFLGGQALTRLSTVWGDLLPQAKLEWEHDLLQGPISSPALLGGVSFSTETPRESPNGLLVTLGATLQRTDAFSLRAEYDGDIRSDFSSHTGLIKAGWEF